MTSSPNPASGFHDLSSLEFAAGWAPEADDQPPALPTSHAPAHPLTMLELVLLEALQKRPCVVGFSGGRDSSAILAVAVRVARREGLSLPVPVTKVYPGVASADETGWQELVVRWLGIEEWVRHDYTDELDLLGPAAVDSLKRHGLLWPATAHNRGPTLQIARGGAYVDGEGGDEVLGDMRITPVTRLLRREVPLDRRQLRSAASALAPGRLRRAAAARHQRRSTDRSWLRPAVREWYVDAILDDLARERLHYADAVRQMGSRRVGKIALGNLDAIGRSHGVTYVHPLSEPRFVAAVADFGGRLGLTGRTAMMRALFTGLLPDEVNARSDKATFNNAFIHNHSREFLARWDGTGLDDELVNPEALRQVWAQPVIHGGTFQLIHAAWLATQPAASA